LIDSGGSHQFAQAKAILEQLISRDPSMVQGYVELARIAMKTNWGPEGLHHAEGLLSSALQIQPDNTNAKILKGYVYAHQERYKAAEKLFVEAAASNPPNLWLWANWGEVLAMQGKTDQAIAKYREAIERPSSDHSNGIARADAYTRLLNLLERKQDASGLEALYKKGIAEAGENSCLGLSYSRFLLEQRSDIAGAIDLARKALNVRCRGTDGRTALGLAYYASWSKSEGADRTESLHQARIYLPPGPTLMYLLARNAKTSDVAAKLVAAGEKIDQKDNENLSALAHAIQDENLQAARRLLRLGAKTDIRVGYGDVPVALMPVMSGNIEMIKLLQEYGADYARLSYQGTTAFEFAKQTGDADLSEVLSRKPRTL
jgi:tetratricopeptide (TPR) repeat protein